MKNILSFTLLLITTLANAQYPVIYRFGTQKGRGSLILSGKTLFGINEASVFSVDITGKRYKNLIDGVYPAGSLLFAGDKLYGITWGGGTYDVGFIFSVDTSGSKYKKLFDFYKMGGIFPSGPLVISENRLYGMTLQGGINNGGCIFSLDTNGSDYKVLVDFDTTDGRNPQGSLVLYNDKLYGMTTYGVNNNGVIFSMNKNGSDYKNIFRFNNTNGGTPLGSLSIIGNKMYGMTFLGGLYDKGVIFSIDTSGSQYNVLHNFNGTNGSLPPDNLILEGGKLYGMTSEGGGIWPFGCIFSIDTNGSDYKILMHFNSENGYNPSGSLTYSSGSFYGVARSVIFRYMPLKDSIISISNACFGDSSGSASVFAMGGDGARGYSYYWTPGGATTPTITGLTAGTYIITIKDNINNNIIFDSVTITQPSSPLHVNVFTTLSSCDSSGSAEVDVSGGGPPYKYSWSPAVKTDSFVSGLAAGYYTCVVTDSLGCNKSTFFSIKDTGSLKATINISSNLKCFDDSNGIAIAGISGGKPPFSYLWSPAGGDETIAQNLKAGTYFFSAIDENRCKVDTFAVITQPSPILVIPFILSPDNGTCIGALSVDASGGTSPYTYYWSGGFASESIYNLYSGQYCCTVTDVNGCIDSNACITLSIASGISKINDKNETIRVFPNPFSSQATLQTDNIFNGATMTIYNSVGQQVKQVRNISGHTITLHRDNLPNGVYILQFKQNNITLMVEKLIITDN